MVTLQHLPLEVLEVIVSHLTAEDLTHCLGVSRTWYTIFSNDIFWKKHCIANWNDYLSNRKCLVKPGFELPKEPLVPIQEYRLRFLQEQHLWKNWDSGRFKKEEIEFDCDDSISYNIKVSFFDNDHICLHTTSETQIWKVDEDPSLVMTIPYKLKELWEQNVYKVIENNLVVIQCNVVQVYNILLDSKSWYLNHVFFYNKPEEFSSSITAETDVDGLFQVEPISDEKDFDEKDFQHVICGEYLVGVCLEQDSPPLHIWNIKTGKKIKEDKCEICKGSYSVELTAPRTANNVLVTFTFKTGLGLDLEENSELDSSGERCCSIVYDLSQLRFLTRTLQHHAGRLLYFDGYLSVIGDLDCHKIVRHLDRSTKSERELETTCLPENLQFVRSIQPLGSNLLFSTSNELFLVNTSETTVQHLENLSLMKVNYNLDQLDVLFNRYALLHDVCFQGIKEIWKLGKSLRKVMEFPEDSGTCVANNNVCSKIVLERGNKLIVLNFW